MTTTANAQRSDLGMSKLIGIGIAAYAVIEAIAAYFLFFAPLYIKPVYRLCEEYNANGTPCIVKLFGKMFATKAQTEEYLILNLWDSVFNVILIYLIITGATLLLAFCMYKGMSFAKTYFTAVFGARHVIGLMALIVPFGNMLRSTMIFGIVVSVISLGACLYFVKINNEEYADDMLLTPEQIAYMNKRMKLSMVLYGLFLAFIVLEKFAMPAYGNNWSLYLGWLTDSGIGQGWALALMLAVALVAAIMYVREADWAMYFFTAFGVAGAASNIVAIIARVLWIFNTYNPMKAAANGGDADAQAWVVANGMTSSWWIATICLILAALVSLVVAFIGLKRVGKKLSFKYDPEDKKPATAVLIGSASVVISFILTIAAITIWHKMLYAGYSSGAMDYMYFIIYGGITLFVAMAMMGGYDFAKFGALAIYLIVASNNFMSIFTVFAQRSSAVAAGTVTTGSNYIIAGILFIVSILACLAIIPVFAVKGVSNYQYEKRFR